MLQNKYCDSPSLSSRSEVPAFERKIVFATRNAVNGAITADRWGVVVYAATPTNNYVGCRKKET